MDVNALAKLYDADGPFVTVYLDTSSNAPDAAQRLDLRWANVLRELADLGVEERTRAALTDARGEHGQGNTRVLVAVPGSVLLATSLPEPPAVEEVRVGPLPHLLPLVDRLALQVPHVVVLTDRQGAEVLAYADDAEAARSDSVDSGQHPVHKTGTGGWSAARYEHAVEENWEASARQVAEAVATAAEQVAARVLVVAGDDHAVSLLREHLPRALQPRVVVVQGSRARDGSDEHLADQVIAAVGQRVAADTLELLARYAQERGQQDRAADGPAETVAALRMAAVQTLLLADTRDPERLAYFGPDPTLLALRREELTDLGVTEPRQAPLADVLLRAALGTGADVRLVSGGEEEAPREGVGALLRFSPGA